MQNIQASYKPATSQQAKVQVNKLMYKPTS